MSTLADKITQLEALVDEKEKKLEKKIRQTIILYAVIVVLVAAYTIVVGNILVGFLSPQMLAEQLQATLSEQIPALRETVVTEARRNTRRYVRNMADKLVESVPVMEGMIFTKLDGLTEYLAAAVEHEVMPTFAEYIKAHAPELKEKYAQMKDPETGKGIALIFLSVLETEMDKYLNEKLIGSMEGLQKDLIKLSKPGAALNRKQDAERRALRYWAYLAEHGDTGNSVVLDLVEKAKQRFLDIMGMEEEEPVLVPEVKLPK